MTASRSSNDDKMPSGPTFLSLNGVTLLKAVVILALGTVALYPALYAPWYGDDDVMLNNPLLHDPEGICKAWFEPGSSMDYYPLLQTVQWFQWKAWGMTSTLGYHVTNLVLHLVSALLLWRLLDQLGLKLAWIGGLIFAIHPLMVDSVGVACELKNTLSLPPFLLAMSCYLDFEQHGQRRDYLRALGLFLAAMLCKITMYFFPILILLYAWWKRGRIFWGDLRKSILFFIVSLVVCVMYLHSAVIYLGATHFQAPGPIPLHGLLERFALAGLMLTFCFGRVFLPLHPMPFYPHWKLEPLGLWIALPWLGIILALVYCWNNRRGWGRPALFGVAFFGLGLAPFLGFFNSVYMCVTWVDDHFLYIPIIGLIALIIGGIEGIGRLISRGFLACAIVAGAASLILLAFQTRIYSTLFADQEKLWLYNLKYNPDAWIARTQLGQAYAQKHEYDKAIEQFQESVRINPDFYNSHLFLGIYLCYAGRLSEGASSFAEAVRLQPALPEARLYLAHALYQTGQVPEAMAQLNEIVRLQPNSLEARDGLSYGLEREGRLPDAIAEIQAALDYYPRNPKLLARMEELENAAQKRANPPVHGHAPPK